MITIRATSLAKTVQNLEQLRKKVSDTADGRFRQKVLVLFEQLLKVSPQFSGDFTSNWFIQTGSDIPSYRMWPGKIGMGRGGQILPMGTVHQAGDLEAINYAMTRAKFALTGVTRETKVMFINATELTTDGTHMIGPDGIVDLRPENIIPGRVRIESYLRARVREMNAEERA